MRIILYVIGGGDDVVVEGGVAGGVAAEDDAGAVELEGVMERVEHLRRDEAPRQEHVGPAERPRPRRRRRSHRLRSRSLSLSHYYSINATDEWDWAREFRPLLLRFIAKRSGNGDERRP